MPINLDAKPRNENSNLLRLKASIQQYDWGKLGNVNESLVANFAKGALGNDYGVKENERYAEIWMGTHLNGPTHLWDMQKTSLQKFISSDSSRILGSSSGRAQISPDPESKENASHIPFLFKILSIDKALPLQAHPDRELGKKLHAKNSKQFVDANHKPEIAVALKDGFRGFVGFRPAAEIKPFLKNIPELREAIGDPTVVDVFMNASKPDGEHVKAVFSALLTRPQEFITPLVESLVRRINEEGFKVVDDGMGQKDLDDLVQVVKKLNLQYPGDVGVLAASFFMNLVTLNKGSAIYIGADEAHAYLEGDIIECMAISDNVLNSAFVPPKERDTDVFLSALTYTSRPPLHWALPRESYDGSSTGTTTKFDPPLEEFTVLWTSLEGNNVVREVLKSIDGPSIGILTKGTAMIEISAGPGKGETLALNEVGAVVFVAAGNEIIVNSHPESPTTEIWWAICAA